MEEKVTQPLPYRIIHELYAKSREAAPRFRQVRAPGRTAVVKRANHALVAARVGLNRVPTKPAPEPPRHEILIAGRGKRLLAAYRHPRAGARIQVRSDDRGNNDRGTRHRHGAGVGS